MKKTYTSTECQSYHTDYTIFNELTTFNKNVEFEPSEKAMSSKIQEKDENGTLGTRIWTEFVNANPDYLCLEKKPDENPEFKNFININGKLVKDLNNHRDIIPRC